MSKKLSKQNSIELRKQGYSYSYISEKIGVSKGTLSAWLAGVPYKPNDFVLARIKNAPNNAVALKKKIKKDSELSSYTEAVKEVGVFTKRDLFMLGIGLYLGEGSKTELIRIVNSDPRVLRISLAWFNKIYHLRNDNFKIRIHLYPDCNEREAVRYWSREIGLPVSCFQNIFVDKRTNKKKKNQGKLPYGTAHISIKGGGNPKLGTHFLRKILALIDISAKKAELV